MKLFVCFFLFYLFLSFVSKSYQEKVVRFSKESQCPKHHKCEAKFVCHSSLLINIDQECLTSTNEIGQCCPIEEDFLTSNAVVPFPNFFDTNWQDQKRAPLHLIRQAETHAQLAQNKVEQRFRQNSFESEATGAEKAHSAFFGDNAEANRLAVQGEMLISMTKHLAESNSEQSHSHFPSNSGSFQANIFLQNTCPKEPKCYSTRYRRADGSCTNLNHPSWASSMSPFTRVLTPDYADLINAPRIALSGNPLPNARQLSVSLSPLIRQPPVANSISLALMQFGQFIDHDLALTALSRTKEGQPISCCSAKLTRKPSLHPLCMPIEIHPDDPFFGPRKQRCMNFVRSAAASRLNCDLGPREQINQLTSVLDGSMIYGSSEATQRLLRTFEGGKLITSSGGKGSVGLLLPSLRNGTCNVPGPQPYRKCFQAGDIRSNENVHLTALHVIFLRLHNSIAEQLHEINPSWSDNALFEESKRLVGALIQHIVYNEFLPVLLGYPTVAKFGLLPLRHGYFQGYNPKVNPSVFSGFSSAAYRLHSMVEGDLQLINNEGKPLKRIRLADTFNDPSMIRNPGMLDALLNGLTTQAQQRMDALFSEQIQNHLFRPYNASYGLDLIAINIQRGRDHGIPSYNQWRHACNLPTFNTFEQLTTVMPKEVVDVLARFYQTPHDLDLFVAGTAEYHVKNALVGPTFACIIAEQFRRLKVGDRFYYENGNQESSFTIPQLDVIRQIQFARLLCDHGDELKYMQPYVFYTPSFQWNQKMPCDNPMLSRLDLFPWMNSNVVN